MSEIRPADAAINHLKRNYTPGRGRPSEDVEPAEELKLDIDLLWPPPGLAHLHGLLNRVTGSLLLAALVLSTTIALPLLLERPSDSGSWGTVIAFIIAGVLLWGAYMWLLVLFNRAATGIESGYPRRLVWLVAADSQRNTFEIMRGSGPYERLTVEQRRALLRARVTASLVALAAALWLTISLPVLLAFGASAAWGTNAFWAITLLPAILLFAISVYHRLLDARMDFGSRIPDEDARVISQQAAGWRELFEHIEIGPRASKATTRYRLGAAAAFIAVFLMLLPLGMAIFTTFVPRLLQGNVGLFTHTVRLAALAPLRAYRMPIDSTITATEAGEAFHRLAMTDAHRHRDLKPATPSMGDELSLLARAGHMDYAGPRWTFVEHRAWRYATPHAIPVTVADLDEKTETELKEILSAGFLIADESLSTTDALLGGMLAQMAGSSLARRLRARGAIGDAQLMTGVIEASAQARSAAFPLGVRSRMSQTALRRVVTNQNLPRAFRWEALMYASWSARCGTLTSLAFGPSRDYANFLESARKSLIRYPAEQSYFNAIVGNGRCSLDWVRDAVGLRR